jgi:hypothetical protein
MARQAVNEVTDGLGTKSAKIHALAQAGYDRAEIARALGIRYQHVRNVLVRSGNTGGLRRQIEVEREPVTVEAALGLPQAISWAPKRVCCGRIPYSLVVWTIREANHWRNLMYGLLSDRSRS